MNHAEWLAQNSIDCAPLGARISKAQCQANQGHTFACEDCPVGGVKYVGPVKTVTKSKRGLQQQEQPAIVPVITEHEELIMTTKGKATPRGTCPSCKRDDVIMNGLKCPRCYYRISKGQDPMTGKSVAAQEAPASPIADTPPIAMKNAKKPALGMTGGDICTINVIQVLDAALQTQRDELVRQLMVADSDWSRMELTIHFVDCIVALGK